MSPWLAACRWLAGNTMQAIEISSSALDFSGEGEGGGGGELLPATYHQASISCNGGGGDCDAGTCRKEAAWGSIRLP